LIVSSLGVGQIYKHSNESCQLVITSIKELEILDKHFDLYPLITQKRADYELFKRVLELIKEKEHLTEEGLRKILGIKASMNPRGSRGSIKERFSRHNSSRKTIS